MLVAALVIQPAGDQNLQFLQYQLPPMCGFRMGTGLPCPGCGLTRSWVHLAHGDLLGSFAQHRLGWLTMGYVFLQAIRHGMWLAQPKKRKAIDRWGKKLDTSIIVLGILLVLNWLPIFSGLFHKVFGQ